MTVDELMGIVQRDRSFYEESGGGVTFSGGEPLDQSEFLLECLRRSKDGGLHTTVDTSGHAPRASVLRAALLTDLFLFDLKVLDDERHRRVVGAELEPVLDNLRALDDAGAEIWIRFPFIPGITDDEKNVESLGKLVTELRTSRVHVLPFHRSACDKYARISQRWCHSDLPEASEESVAAAADALRNMGLDVVIGG
jgi:pyruvate formate lyase activating enzyme